MASLTVLPSIAQVVRLDGVRIIVHAASGSATYPDYQTFVQRSRNPSLFRNTPASVDSSSRSLSFTGLAVDFEFAVTHRKNHRILVGFGQQGLNQKLHSFRAVDTTSAGIALESSNQYLDLRGRYHYRLGFRNRASVVVGLGVDVALPVSAQSIETVSTSEKIQENKFFAKRSTLLAFRIPIALRVRVFTATDLELSFEPGRVIAGLDGNRVTANFRSFGFGLFFVVAKRNNGNE